jgi:hypothetical protein
VVAHLWHKRIECQCDGVEVIAEQPGVNVERHRRGCVAQHALQRLHVGAVLNTGQARRTVPQVVRTHPGQTQPFAGWLEDAGPPRSGFIRRRDSGTNEGRLDAPIRLEKAAHAVCGRTGWPQRTLSADVRMALRSVLRATSKPSPRRCGQLHAGSQRPKDARGTPVPVLPIVLPLPGSGRALSRLVFAQSLLQTGTHGVEMGAVSTKSLPVIGSSPGEFI